MILTLPWPPAVNNLFATYNNRRIPTRRYKAWLSEALDTLAVQRWVRLDGPFTAVITCWPPDRRRRDLDGLMKAPLDALVKAGVVTDDSHARELTIGWSGAPPGQPGGLTIRLERAG